MKTSHLFFFLPLAFAEAGELNLRLNGSSAELSWQRNFPPSSGVPSILQSRILSSTDLVNWVEDHSVTLDDSSGNGMSSLTMERSGEARFYRLEQFLSYAHRASSSEQPAEYNQQFQYALHQTRQLDFEAFTNPPADPACLLETHELPGLAGVR